jgi:ceroid-lipofuscinosis MFS transporter 7
MEDGNYHGYAPSITSTIMTAEGLADPAGFSIICCVVLVGDMTRGVTFPIMWPLVQDLGGNSVWLGYAVGAFSFGRVIASPCFGRWSIEKGYSKTLVASTTIMLVGCVFFAHVISVGSLPFLVFSKIIMGIGSATLGVTRAYVAEITATRQRTTYMALLSAVQYGAYTGMSKYSQCIMMTHDYSTLFCTNDMTYHLVPSDTDIWGTLLLHTQRPKI